MVEDYKLFDNVIYIPNHAKDNFGKINYSLCENGVVTGFNDKFVFVRYANQNQSKSTLRENLVLR